MVALFYKADLSASSLQTCRLLVNLRMVNSPGDQAEPHFVCVMVDDLWCVSGGPRIKYVDDLTILEVIPRNSPSVMKYLVNDVNSFAHCNNIQLNPSKCKLMRVDFLHYNSCYSQPIAVGGLSVIESVESFKLSWGVHFLGPQLVGSLRLYNKEIKPPPLCSKKTESLWGARWGVGGCVLLLTKICFRVCIGSVCKFTAVSLQGFRKSAKESPTNHPWSCDLSYEDTLARAGLLSLEARRHLACKKFVSETMHASPLYRLISSRVRSFVANLVFTEVRTIMPCVTWPY